MWRTSATSRAFVMNYAASPRLLRHFYEKLVRAATEDPGLLDQQLSPLRELIPSIADRKDYSLVLTKGTQIRIFASSVARLPVPYFWSSKFEQALVLTAVFYLGQLPRWSLGSPLSRSYLPEAVCGVPEVAGFLLARMR